jgi:hypothetical protein
MELKLNIPDDKIDILLSSAFNGGMTSQWARVKLGKKPEGIVPEEIAEWPTLGGSVIVIDMEHEPKPKEHILDRAALKRGLRVMATLKPGEGGHHFGDFMAGNGDEITGDVFIQCCLFGEIVYG